ncbi:MAG: hypothetical protein AB1925_02010 [Actinomycetota bacterium]
MRRVQITLSLALASLLAGCEMTLPDHISIPPALTGGEPQTLEAATASSQEVADRRTSGDFAGVWLMLTRQQRDAISQSDYVTLQQTCSETGLPAHATGVRLDDPTTAIVRWNIDIPRLSGFADTKTMLYEDGKWVLAPDPDFVWDYGVPIDELIAQRRAAGECDKTIGPTTSVPSPAPTPRPDAPSPDVTGTSTGGTGELVAVRVAARENADRFVMEFRDGVPAYRVGYRPLPAHMDGSGNEIPLPGANALVEVVLTGATGNGWTEGVQTYFGPASVSGDTVVITEAKAAGDFEAVVTWAVGLRKRTPFLVSVLDGPPRLVIDFPH